MVVYLIKKYWFEIMIVVGVVMILGYIKYLGNEINKGIDENAKLQSIIREQKAYLTAQNIMVEANRADYQAALKRLPTVLHEIDTKYKTEYQTIYAWRDNNETHDCNSSLDYLNRYKF